MADLWDGLAVSLWDRGGGAAPVEIMADINRVPLLLHRLAELCEEARDGRAGWSILSRIVAEAAYVQHFVGETLADRIAAGSLDLAGVEPSKLVGEGAYREGRKQGRRDRKRVERYRRKHPLVLDWSSADDDTSETAPSDPASD